MFVREKKKRRKKKKRGKEKSEKREVHCCVVGQRKGASLLCLCSSEKVKHQQEKASNRAHMAEANT